MLYKPRFLIAARMRFWDEDADIVKHEEMFLRRARNGQYARRPYLGLRELTASFRYIEVGEVDEAVARNGQYARRPYLGLRELTANFRYIEVGEVDEAVAEAIDFWSDSGKLRPPQDLGYMVYDPWDITVRPIISPNGRVSKRNPKADSSPNRFKKFHAVMELGWLTSSDLAGTNIPPRLPTPEELYK